MAGKNVKNMDELTSCKLNMVKQHLDVLLHLNSTPLGEVTSLVYGSTLGGPIFVFILGQRSISAFISLSLFYL